MRPYLVNFSTTYRGRCQNCPANTYKEFIGSWHSQCNQCSIGSVSLPGSTDIEQCTCIVGWKFTANSPICFDVEECDTGTHNCNPKAQCENTQGSFYCACSSTLGYVNGEGDETNYCDAECGDGLKMPQEDCDDRNQVSEELLPDVSTR